MNASMQLAKDYESTAPIHRVVYADRMSADAPTNIDATMSSSAETNGRGRVPSAVTKFKQTTAFYLMLASLALLAWSTLFTLAGAVALPGGHLFALFLLAWLCWLAGELVRVVHLPPLLGMLVVGFCLRNIPYVDIAKNLNPAWASALRNCALAIILARAGLGLDADKLRKLSFTCAKLALVPCLLEGVVVALCARFILHFPWLWAFILGFVIAGVSPAVVVPSMLGLQAKGYGVARGIPTLLIASGSLDNVVAIAAFGVVLSITFSSKSILMTVLQGPLEVLIGVGYGLILGKLICVFEENVKDNSLTFRSIFILFGCTCAIFGSRWAAFPGSGPLGCLVLAFVAAYGWRKWNHVEVGVCRVFNALWLVFQPILFGLIGSEVILASLEGNTVVLGLATVCCGVAFRFICTYTTMISVGFSRQESLFIGIAWSPKATVQAAIGSIALDTARQLSAGSEAIDLGKQVLTIAVLAILITAPTGAIAIDTLAPKLLRRGDDESEATNNDS